MAKGWHKEDIKAAIRKKGVTLLDLDALNGFPPSTCANALLRPSFSAELAIAEFLGVSPRQIWPARYTDEGTYKHPRSEAHHTRRAILGALQKDAAA
jgi:Ner family transcriptional regulator